MASIGFLGLQNLPLLAPEHEEASIPRGGAELQQILLARAIIKKGCAASMVVLDAGQEEGVRWDGIVTHKAYRLDAGIPIFRFIHPRWTSIWSALGRANADGYYTSIAGMHVGLLAMYCRTHKKRFIYRVSHDNDCQPHALRMRVGNFRDRVLFQYGLRHAHVILTQSARQSDLLKQHFNLDSTITKSFADFDTDNATEPMHRDIDLLWVASLRGFKRPDLAIKLAERLPEYTIHMVGRSGKSAGDRYPRIEEQMSNLPNLLFHGAVPYRKTMGLFARAKVFINTSDEEGFPNTYLQAWAHGVPVVARFDPDQIISNENLGFHETDIREMEQRIRFLLERKSEWDAVSSRCHDFIEREHADEVVLRPYLQAIGSLLRKQ